MASIWKGSIAFGLVNVPVELRSAVQDHRLHFRMLHDKSNAPIRFKRVREDTGAEVAWSDIVRGYEVEKGEFVILDEKDFEDAAIEQSHTIDLVAFVADEEIDTRYYETSYFVVPTKGGERAYALLRDAMAEAGLAGVGKIVLHKRQHIAEVRPSGDAIVLMLLRFADELVETDTYSFPPASKSESKEFTMATQLVKTLAAEFDPAEFKDEYDANLQRIIDAKAKGHRATLKGPDKADHGDKVVDLMERLRQSLEAGTSKPPAKAAAKHAPRQRRKRTAEKATA